MIARMMNVTLGKLQFGLTFLGVSCIFRRLHYLGLAGNVRRYASFTDDYLVPPDSGAQVHYHQRLCSPALRSSTALQLIHTRWWGPLAPAAWERRPLEW